MRQNQINQLTYFTVSTTRDEFPTDMLRYDRCWPQTSDDAVLMQPMRRVQRPGTPREIRMVGLRPPTRERWTTFGWQVIAEQTRSV